MIEHTYLIRGYGASWFIYIKILADIEEGKNKEDKNGIIKVGEGVWLKFSDQPLIEHEIFCADDLPYLVKGLQIVQKEIRTHSIYQETLIIIKSLQFNPCHFQEEGLIAAIMEWASLAFHFQMPVIDVFFQREQNQYVFDFN